MALTIPVRKSTNSSYIADRKRVSRPKVKTGCLSCKTRHIKCDEAKPICENCRRRGRKCDGYLPTAPMFALEVIGTKEEQRAFHYFVQQAVPDMSDTFELPFWQHFVPRLSHSTPALFYLVSAIGSAHEIIQNQGIDNLAALNTHSHYAFTLRQTNKAIHMLLHNPSSHSLTFLLTSCLILFSLANLLPDRSGNIYMAAGARMLKDFENQIAGLNPNRGVSKSEAALIQNTLSPCLRSCGSVLGSALDPIIALKTGLSEEGLPDRRDQPSVPPVFQSVIDARDNLYDIFEWIYSMLKRDAKSAGIFVLEEQYENEVITALHGWTLTSNRLLAISTDIVQIDALNMLKAYQVYGYLVVKAQGFTAESDFDQFLPHFQSIISSYDDRKSEGVMKPGRTPGPRFVFGLGPSVWAPLLFTAIYCRDPTTRRHAHQNLEHGIQIIGLLSTHIPARVAKLVIHLEEQGLNAPKTAADIPEKNRIRLHEMACFYEKPAGGKFKFGYIRAPHDPLNAHRIEEVWITLTGRDYVFTEDVEIPRMDMDETTGSDASKEGVTRKLPDFVFRRGFADYFDRKSGQYLQFRAPRCCIIPSKISD